MTYDAVQQRFSLEYTTQAKAILGMVIILEDNSSESCTAVGAMSMPQTKSKIEWMVRILFFLSLKIYFFFSQLFIYFSKIEIQIRYNESQKQQDVNSF